MSIKGSDETRSKDTRCCGRSSKQFALRSSDCWVRSPNKLGRCRRARQKESSPLGEHMNRANLSKLAILSVTLLTTISGVAQQRAADAPHALTAADYARAEKFMGYNTTP